MTIYVERCILPLLFMNLFSAQQKNEEIRCFELLFLDAVQRCDIQTVARILEKFRPTKIYPNPLHIAVSRQNIELLYLLAKKYLFETVEKDLGQTIIHRAVDTNNLELVKSVIDVLKNYGQRTELKEEPKWEAEKKDEKGKYNPLNITNDQKQTPLHLAALNRNKDIYSLLIENKVDQTIVDHLGNVAENYLTDKYTEKLPQPREVLYYPSKKMAMAKINSVPGTRKQKAKKVEKKKEGKK